MPGNRAMMGVGAGWRRGTEGDGGGSSAGGGARARAAVRPSVRAHPPTRCTCARVCRCRHMTRTKLEMAFAELRCRGILAYHNFKCCVYMR